MFSKPHYVRVDDHGRTVVPVDLRRELDLCPDDVLLRRDQGDRRACERSRGIRRRVRGLASRILIAVGASR
jgi:bifunctional DNA-binding transcriptional regulator/antitoxin component of YhaV-PrlF toxin-antitoxin module